YGSLLSKGDNDAVEAGETVANWEAHTLPIITEVAGRIQFVDMIDGVTVSRQTDDLTGLSSSEVTDAAARPAAGKDMRPAIKLVDEQGNDV
ncbi:hypothetical protein OFO29_33810, partial [Escherichia coli]|nr:hypothetical protein [Escherichia coli]